MWTTLWTRYGDCIASPAAADLTAALDEVLDPAVDEEHPNAWLEHGAEDGATFVLDVYAGGRVVFNQWASADYDERLAPDAHLTGVDRAEALALWQRLSAGDVEGVRARSWRLNEPGGSFTD